MTTKLLQFWQKAATDLGLQLVTPFCLMLTPEHELKALLLIKKFGAPNGMLVFSGYDEISSYVDDIARAGYGFSVLDEPLDFEEYSKDEYIELLGDWGWSGDMENKPDWL